LKRFFTCLLLAFASSTATAQTVRFVPSFGNEALELNSSYTLHDGTDVNIETLRFYISNMEISNKDVLVWKEADSYHLLDASKSESLQFPVPFEKGDKLVFLLGTDSLTNVSGAMGGALDPSNGMYWAWNSGYINFKLEGTSPVCQTRNNGFEFHLGGYAYPNATVQQIELPITGNVIKVDVEAFLNQINLEKENMIMSPGLEAVTLAKKAATIFHFKYEK